MKELLLLTFANKIYREILELKGFHVTEYSQPLSDDSISEIIKLKFKGIAVIEVIEDSMERLDKIIVELRKKSVRVIALAPKINENFREYFLKQGISEVMEPDSTERLASYLDLTERSENKKYGKIMIFDDSDRRLEILTTIINRFNYSPVIPDSVDRLFDELSGVNIQLIFLNIGSRDFDLQNFLKRSFSFDIIKKILIPYKDTGEALFIHEMISGLNRVAKVILTADEVYSFLVDVLFRKELSPGMSLLNETLDYINLNKIGNETLSRLYTLMGPDIFTMKKIITKDNIRIIDGRVESLRNLLLKVEGLKWLIKDNPDKSQYIGNILRQQKDM